MKSKYILIIDQDQPETRPLARFQCISSFRTGIYSQVDRLRRAWPRAEICYGHPDSNYEKLISSQEGMQSIRDFAGVHQQVQSPDDLPASLSQSFLKTIYTSEIQLLQLPGIIATQIKSDLKFWLKQNKSRLYAERKLRKQAHFIGKVRHLHIHKSVDLLPGVIFDTREGPIVLDKEVKLSPYTYIAGPIYVGPQAYLDNLRIGGGCSIGRGCRLGGEIESSIVQDFSNKHHEGFLGHSLVGRWVNLGALATTSDLKNNYGEIRLALPQHRRINQHRNTNLKQDLNQETNLAAIDTGSIKFGSILGDCVKVAIGSMLNTGTVIDAGCNVFGGTPPAYLPPLSWGIHGDRYRTDRFLSDCQKIFRRRGQTLTSEMHTLLEDLMSPANA